MNKKVSTLFAMSLLAGSLCNGAYAEKLEKYVDTETAVESVSGNYFLKIGDEYLASDFDNDAKSIIKYFTRSLTADDAALSKETLNQYLWTVSETSGLAGNKSCYTFRNVATNQLIRVQVTKSGETYSYSLVKTVAKANDPFYETAFQVGTDGSAKYSDKDKPAANRGSVFTLQTEPESDYLLYDETEDVDDLTISTASGETITLQKLLPGITVDTDALNKLYNSAGFNFTLKDSDLADVNNIFAEKKIIAIEVPAKDLIATVAGTPVYGIKGTVENSGFPAGIYFATSVPRLLKTDSKGNVTETVWYDYLVQSTFIAVDADSNIADDEDAQKAGNGFTLTEVSGKDLALYVGDKEANLPTGDQNSVYNACFSAKESTTEENVFALYLNRVRIQEKAGADKQIDVTTGFAITADEDATAINTVADKDKAGNFVFKFSESTVVKAIDLLNEDGAAIYNIRFYKKNGKDNSYNAKYLTTDATGNRYVAKGKVIADLDAPAYQWVITSVDGNNVTFKNRETKATLKTMLFNEGNGLYSLAPDPEATQDAYFTYYNVTEEGNVTLTDKDGNLVLDNDATKSSTHINLQGTYVELIDSKAVNYAGYLNVDDKTVMTLSFGRDIAPTSNKLYPYVTVDGSSYSFKDFEELTNEIGEAAQWLLIKNPNGASVAKYNYAYANGELINIKNSGDVVYANTYALQLVLDGKAIAGEYLNVDKSGNAYLGSDDEQYFYIQENVDGSVLLKTKRISDEALFLDDVDRDGDLIMNMKDLAYQSFDMDDIQVSSLADEVKTYLIAEAPAISLPAKEGHYSFINEWGNYITMNEERDGLTVKEESEPLYLYVTDEDAVVPSFYITKAAENKAERMFLFNPQDSVKYYVAEGDYNKTYQLSEVDANNEHPTKAIFKAAAINETRDTLTTSIKGETTLVAMEANNTEEVEGGLNRFKMQITESPEEEGLYVIRQVNDNWLYAVNGKLAWTSKKSSAMLFTVEGAEAPTANEGVSATEVKIIATDGAVNVKNAAGKNVVISTILGQIVANEVLTSDNATISVPAGIAIVSVDGEEAVKVSVR